MRERKERRGGRGRRLTGVMGAWRGLAREAPQGGGRLVGVLPW
eukprot:SAG31_NODE_16466_length_708_cov_0.926108_1_plen_42_part_10